MALFPVNKCAKSQGQPTSKIFCSPLGLCIFWMRNPFFLIFCYVVQSWNLYYQKNKLCNYSSLMKTLLLRHSTYICCAIEPLLIFVKQCMWSMMSQSALKLYQPVLLKQAKTYHLYHCFHLLLIHTSESTIRTS